MRRIKRLLSLALVGALLLGAALTDGFVGDNAFRPGRALAESSDDGSEGEAAPSGEQEGEAAESQEKEEKQEEKQEAPEQKQEEKATHEEVPEQKAEEEKAPEEAPEQMAEEEKGPEEAPEQKAEEQTPEEAAEEKAEAQTPEETTEQKAEEAASEEATPEEEPKQKKEAEKADSKEAEDNEDEDVRLTLAIASPGSLSASGGTWQVDPAQVSALTLAWSCEGTCDAFEVSVSGGVYSGTTRDTALKLSVGGLFAGKYTATVKAIRGGKTVAKEKLSFRILASGEPADAGLAQRDAEEAPTEDAVPNAPDPELVLDDGVDPETEDVPGPAGDGMVLDVQIDLDTADEAVDPEDEDPEAEDPEALSLSLTVASPQGLTVTDGVYHVDPSQVDALTFSWECSGDCDGYAVSVSGDVYNGETADTTLTLPVSQLAAGQYTVTVEALKGGSAAARAQLVFRIADATQQPGVDQQPEGGAPTGGMPTGGAPKGGGTQGAMAEEEQGFHVTPGEALVSTHTSGSRDMTLYNAVALTLDTDAEMTALVLGGVPLDVTLDGGSAPFTGRIEGGTLTLTAAAGDTWALNGRALRILSDSGIDRLMLQAGNTVTALETAQAFRGSVYASLCREGFVSADYTCRVNAGGMTVEVAGNMYRVGDAGELMPMEGDGNAETMVYSASDAA